MDTLTQALAAGQTWHLPAGRFLFLKLAGSPVDIKFIRSGRPAEARQFDTGFVYGLLPEGKGWERAELYSASAQTVTVIIGNDTMDYRRFVGLVDINKATTRATGQVTIGTVETLIAAQASARRSITIKALSTNTEAVSIINTGGSTATGFLLLPGEALTDEATAAIYGISASGGQAVCFITDAD